MALSPRLRPTRRHVLPWLAAAFPACWFVHREYAPLDDLSALPIVAALTLAALLGSYLVAVGAVAFADARSWRIDALGPSERGWPLLAALLVGVVAYFSLSLLGRVPGWLDAISTPVGVVVGLPLFAAVLALVYVGNALGAPPLAAEIAVVAVALSVTAAWTVAVVDAAARAYGAVARSIRR